MNVARRLQIFATNSNQLTPHNDVLHSLMNSAGYHYDGKKTQGEFTTHKLSYEQKRTPEHNARIIHIMQRAEFTHNKIPHGHRFDREDATMEVVSKPGKSCMTYTHKTEQ